MDATECPTGINNFEANAVAVTVICAKILQRRLAVGLVPSGSWEIARAEPKDYKPVKGGQANHVALRNLRQKRNEQLQSEPLKQAHKSLAEGKHPESPRPSERRCQADESLHILPQERKGHQGCIT